MPRGRRLLRLAPLALVLAWAGRGASRADVRPDFTPNDVTGWSGAGSFHFKPFFAIHDVGYDSNVFLDPDNGNPKSAYTATVSPSGVAVLDFGSRGSIAATGGFDYVWFSTYANQSHFNYQLGLKGTLNFRSLRFFGGVGYQKLQERPSNEIDQRTVDVSRTVRGGVGYEFSPATAVDLILQRQKIEYSDEDFLVVYACLEPGSCPAYDIGDLLSRTERSATLQFTHQLTGRTAFVLGVEDRRYDFTGPVPDPAVYDSVPVVGAVRNSVEQRVTAGVDLAPRGSLYGSVQIGMSHFQPSVLSEQATREAVGRISLSWKAASRLLLQARFNRDIFFSVYGDNVYYLESDRGLQSVFYLTRSLGLEAAYESYRLLFPVVDPTLGPLYDEPRIDNIRFLKAAVRIRLQARSAMTIGVGARRRVSNLPGIDDNQFLVMTGVETLF
jgi:hypothetical protein